VGLVALELAEQLDHLLAVQLGGHDLVAIDDVIDRVVQLELAVDLLGYLLPALAAPAHAVDQGVCLTLALLHYANTVSPGAPLNRKLPPCTLLNSHQIQHNHHHTTHSLTTISPPSGITQASPAQHPCFTYACSNII